MAPYCKQMLWLITEHLKCSKHCAKLVTCSITGTLRTKCNYYFLFIQVTKRKHREDTDLMPTQLRDKAHIQTQAACL